MVIEQEKEVPYHGQKRRRVGVLLINHGTPDHPTYFAISRYLRQFLSDRRVVKRSRWFWLPILYLFILPFRPLISKEKYQRIWTELGSPFQIHHKNLLTNISNQLNQDANISYEVDYCMRYGNPSIDAAISRLSEKSLNHICCIPLFPQFSESMTGSIFQYVTQSLAKWTYIPGFSIEMSYHDHPKYIEVISDSIQKFWKERGRKNLLVMSFHSLPQKTLKQGDPYFCLCQKTARLIAENLGLNKDEYRVCFQSRFGREPWLQPYAQDVLKDLAESGHTDIDVICPGFSVDCLETVDEVAFELDEEFREYGGNQLSYIPALNDSKSAVELYIDLIKRFIADRF